MKIPLLLSFLIIPCLPAQILGAIETFTEQDNAESWNLYNFATDAFTPPLWILPNSPDREIYARFTSNRVLSIFATDFSSNGAFTGNYLTTKIDTLESDLYIEDPSTFDSIEIYLFANGLFYYSDYFAIDDQGWSTLSLSLRNADWYLYDEDLDDYLFVTLTDTVLSDVEEIGFNFYPSSTAANGKAVAIDNFTLLPDFTPPTLKITPSGNQVILSFEGNEGFEYTIESSSTLRDDSWTEAAAPFEADGPSQTPFPKTSKTFYRLSFLPYFIEVP